MSHHTRLAVQIRDRSALVRALRWLFGADGVEEHAEPAEMRTFARRDRAEVIVRQGTAARGEPPLALVAGDLGFRFEGAQVVAVYDSLDAAVLARVRQAYAREEALAQAQAHGWAVVGEETDPDGALRIVFAPPDGATVTVAARADGDADIAVAGMHGMACVQATAGMQAALGTVVDQSLTGEAWLDPLAGAAAEAETWT